MRIVSPHSNWYLCPCCTPYSSLQTLQTLQNGAKFHITAISTMWLISRVRYLRSLYLRILVVILIRRSLLLVIRGLGITRSRRPCTRGLRRELRRKRGGRCGRMRRGVRVWSLLRLPNISISSPSRYAQTKLTLIQLTLLLENTRSSSLTLPRRRSSPVRPTCTFLTQPSKPRTMLPEAAVSSR